MALTRPESSVRKYRPGDRDAFLDLYERVWGRRQSAAWFDWRFESNPFGRDVRMIVAERDGELIGAEPLLPFELRAGNVNIRAFQPADWIVDPAYQQQGVFTRMTEQLFESYADDAALLFNFPSDALLPGLEKFGWRTVGTYPMAYRFQRPSGTFRTGDEAGGDANVRLPRARAAAIRVGDAAATPALGLLDRLRWRRPGITVRSERGVPADIIDLYEANPPDGFHVPRTEAYCEWRFSNPRWEIRTYLARRAGRIEAAIVTAVEEQAHGARALRVLDVQPMQELPGRASVLAALFDELLRDARDVDIIRAPASALPSALRRGFVRDDAIGIRRVASPTTQVVRPLSVDDDLQWHLAGRSLTDPANWTLSLVDQDIG